MNKKKFDADELLLSKKYVIGILVLIERRWKSNDTPAKFIWGLKAFRQALKYTPEFMFQNFWKQVLEFINMLEFENGKAQAKSRGEQWVEVLEKIPSKIQEGNFDLSKDYTQEDKNGNVRPTH